MMRFEEAYEGWQEGCLSQCEAACLLGQPTYNRRMNRLWVLAMIGGMTMLSRITGLARAKASPR